MKHLKHLESTVVLMMNYSQVISLQTFDERIEFLKLSGSVGEETFGHMRYINQEFYRSREWRRLRREIIIRDMGCDLGVEGFEIDDIIIVHHINPITMEDILNGNPLVYDPENLICVSKSTHDYIHYGKTRHKHEEITRSKNDQAPWLN